MLIIGDADDPIVLLEITCVIPVAVNALIPMSRAEPVPEFATVKFPIEFPSMVVALEAKL